MLECILARLIILKLCKMFQSHVILNFMYLFVCNYVCKYDYSWTSCFHQECKSTICIAVHYCALLTVYLVLLCIIVITTLSFR